MKNFGKLAVLGAALALSASAFATPVTFSTSGEFVSNSTDTITFGSAGNTTTLTFAGIPSTTLDASPFTFTSFGTVTTSVAGSGASGSGSFDLTITQTVPSPGGSGTLTGVLSGTVSDNASTGLLDFSNLSLVIGTGSNEVVYTLQEPVGGYELVPPSTNGGVTSIQGTITATPEPNSLMLLGTGLLGGAGMLMRRRRLIA